MTSCERSQAVIPDGHFTIHRGMVPRITGATEEIHKGYDDLSDANVRVRESDPARSACVQKAIHDLRAPLQSVMMTPQALATGLEGTLTGPQRDILARKRTRMGGTAKLISGLLDLEQPKDGCRQTGAHAALSG